MQLPFLESCGFSTMWFMCFSIVFDLCFDIQRVHRLCLHNITTMGSQSKWGMNSTLENNRWRSAMDHERTEIASNSRKSTGKHEGRECCMCGDVGFQERLFRCHRCHHRFQHIYCSRLYSDQLKLEGMNVCDWCLYFQAKENVQSHKRRIELQEMAIGKAQKVAACNEIVSGSPSISSMKQPACVAIEKPRKVNAKPRSLKLRVKLGGSKQNQPSSLPKDCKLSTESCRNLPGTSTMRNTTKVGLRRRYKLLSDVLCS